MLFMSPKESYVKDHGYPIEKIEIETADGFLLNYHRIPHGRQGPHRGGGALGHPGLLAHGVLQSSALFLAMDDSPGTVWFEKTSTIWAQLLRENHEVFVHGLNENITCTVVI
jgi:hypothetical protein